MRGSSEYSEVELLSRAHQLFAGDSRRPGLDAGTTPYGDLLSRAADLNVGAGQRRYQLAVDHSRAALLSAARTDAAAGAVITGAQRDRAWARRSTGTVLGDGIAVHAALSRLGRPYVWGATGPNQFDCSGLVQWAYAQAGVHLDRTTYQQINEGIPVPRSQVRPGDLVFPHPGHVQLAIGNNLVVEAPHAGASVRVSSLGNNVQIRRPLSGR